MGCYFSKMKKCASFPKKKECVLAHADGMKTSEIIWRVRILPRGGVCWIEVMSRVTSFWEMIIERQGLLKPPLFSAFWICLLISQHSIICLFINIFN